MKIKISEDETYEIQLSEELEASEVFSLVDRLQKIIKLTRIEVRENTLKPKPNRRVGSGGRKVKWYDTKEKVLDMLQYGYHGTREDKDRLCKLTNYSWNELCKRFHGLRHRFNIQPEEVGLTKWRTKYESKLINNKIPNWTIKSYTGVFDENGNN